MDHHGTFSVVQPKTDVPQMRRFAAEKKWVVLVFRPIARF
jgi:hypothetical protein